MCEDNYDWIEEAEGETRIEKLRNIVKNKQASKIDGQIVDMLTANMLVTVYGALKNDKSRNGFNTIPLVKLVNIGWKCVQPA